MFSRKSDCVIFNCWFQNQLELVIPENISPLTQFYFLEKCSSWGQVWF